MTLTEWAPLAFVCLLGAMSPGPSLALVVRHAATKGAVAGVFCAVTHGAGIFLWASATATGASTPPSRWAHGLPSLLVHLDFVRCAALESP